MGVIGVLQALEVIKIIVSSSHASADADDECHQQEFLPTMTMFAAFDNPQWRTFRLRPRRPNCIACGRNPSVTAESIHETDYGMLCVRSVPAENAERVSVEVTALGAIFDHQEYCAFRAQNHTLIDVRDRTQFGICRLPNSTSKSSTLNALNTLDIPFSRFTDDAELAVASVSRDKPVFVVCRFGNDSQLAVNAMKSLEHGFSNVKDLKGGLHAWAETFPTDVIPKY